MCAVAYARQVKDVDSLRERKKRAAREALHEAAWRLSSEHGPENVTVEAIADAASVSRRTFFNYFGSKEEALFYRDQQRAQVLLDLVRERPSAESATDALHAALISFASSLDRDAERIIQRRLIRSKPALSSYRAAQHITTERALASLLAERLQSTTRPDLSAGVLAASSLAALRVATSYWLDHQDQSLSRIVASALDHVRE